MAQRHRMADGTRGRISAIPAGTGHDGDYRPLCSDTVPTISAHTALCPAIPASETTSRGLLGPGHHRLQASAPDQPPSRSLGTIHQGLGYLGVRARRDPHCSAASALTEASASRAANPQRSASWPPHLLRGSPEAPMMHRVGCDQHVAPVLQRTDHSDDHAATGTGHRARTCCPCWHDAA